MEAMKMENNIMAEKAGKVAQVKVKRRFVLQKTISYWIKTFRFRIVKTTTGALMKKAFILFDYYQPLSPLPEPERVFNPQNREQYRARWKKRQYDGY